MQGSAAEGTRPVGKTAWARTTQQGIGLLAWLGRRIECWLLGDRRQDPCWRQALRANHGGHDGVASNGALPGGPISQHGDSASIRYMEPSTHGNGRSLQPVQPGMGPDRPAQAFGAPSTRARLIAAFAVVVLGLLLVEGAVVLSVHPQLSALHSIADDHARAVEEASRIREHLGRMTSALRTGMLRPEAATLSPPLSVDLQELAASMTRLGSVADGSPEGARIQAFEEKIEQLGREAADLESPSPAVDSTAATKRTAQLIERLGDASAAADAIIAFDARQVEKGAIHVRTSLRRALIAASVAGALGVIAALLLLRHALAGLARERAHWHQRSAEVEAFAARAAHELRSPLQTFALALAAAQRVGSPSAFDHATRGVKRLSRTIDDLLEFARAGVTPGEHGTTAIGPAASEVIEELGAQLQASHAEVRVTVAPDACAAIAPGLLRTILRNLVGNAIKYGVSERSPQVRVVATPAGSRVRIEVSDDGPGISPDQLPHVFETFVRATTKPDGFGLGLATVKRVVEAHRGVVSIWSCPGAGTRVCLDLPSGTGTAVPAASGSAHPAQPRPDATV